MRVFVLAGILSMAAAYAQAGSIDVVKPTLALESIDYVKCDACGPLKPKKSEQLGIVLKPGTQKIELREVNGEMKMFRTEAWLGGSPVTYVSKASPEVIAEKQDLNKIAGDPQQEQPILIDKSTTTSAVSADMGATTAVEVKKPAPFDAKTLELRTN